MKELEWLWARSHHQGKNSMSAEEGARTVESRVPLSGVIVLTARAVMVGSLKQL